MYTGGHPISALLSDIIQSMASEKTHEYIDVDAFSNSVSIDADYMVIVGRYLKTTSDFINLIKVCKKYKDICQIYRYNPVSDPSLFQNVQTQHFYETDDYDAYYDRDVYRFCYVFWKADWKQIDDMKANNKSNYIIKRYLSPKRSYNMSPIKRLVITQSLFALKKEHFDSSFKYVDIKRVTELSEGCFKDSHLEQITLPRSLALLGVKCFKNCKHLKDIVLPRTLTVIPASCFEGSGLKTIKLPYGIKELRELSFAHTKMTSIFLPKTVEYIAPDAFKGSMVKSIYCTKKVYDHLQHVTFDIKPDIVIYKKMFSKQVH